MRASASSVVSSGNNRSDHFSEGSMSSSSAKAISVLRANSARGFPTLSSEIRFRLWITLMRFRQRDTA